MKQGAIKCRICRREGTKLFLKGARCFSPKCPLEKKGAVPPGVHGLRRSFRKSEYGLQLREKQKTKRLYGVSERQFKNYYLRLQQTENRGMLLLANLEMRLDNVVYRLGFAPSRASARQLIRSGHVQVNGKKVKVSSYAVRIGDKIALGKKAKAITYIAEWLKSDYKPPAWLKKAGVRGEIVRLPVRKEMPQDVNESLVVEFYSR